MIFSWLINVEIPTTIADILLFISKLHIATERFKARKNINFSVFKFYEQMKLHACSANLNMDKVLKRPGLV